MGLPIGDQTIHYHLFADDQVIIAQDKEDAEYMTKKLIEEYRRWGLNVNTLKTEYSNIGSDIQNMKLEDNIKIKGSMAFKYLGSIFTNSGICKKVLNRIQQARNAK
jgi:hypothetical protein